MEERHNQRIWPDFDGVSGPGPCHHIAPSLPPHLQRPAAPSLPSPPLCFCLAGFHQQGLCTTWENNTLLYLRVEWDLLKYSTREWSRSGRGERDFIGARWEMKAFKAGNSKRLNHRLFVYWLTNKQVIEQVSQALRVGEVWRVWGQRMIGRSASLPASWASRGQLERRWMKLECCNTPCRHTHKHSHLVHTTVGPPGRQKHADTLALTVEKRLKPPLFCYWSQFSRRGSQQKTAKLADCCSPLRLASLGLSLAAPQAIQSASYCSQRHLCFPFVCAVIM